MGNEIKHLLEFASPQIDREQRLLFSDQQPNSLFAEGKLSHYDSTGRAMVDVSAKTVTRREAEASAFVAMKPAVLRALPRSPKGFWPVRSLVPQHHEWIHLRSTKGRHGARQ